MVRLMRLPLFPLNMVLFPRIPVGLHIFEPRYRRMIRQCIEEHEEFGIVLYQESEVAETGCTATVEGVIKEYTDGRFDILVMGQQRFRVRRFFEEKEHLEADVELFTDSSSASDINQNQLKSQTRKAAEGILSLSALEDFPVETDNLLDLNPEEISLLIAGTTLFSLTEKQELLESTSTSERLERDIQRIGKRIRERKAARKIEELLGGPLDFTLLRN